jgi:hypothetical protein
MTAKATPEANQSQSDKFKEAARELQADTNEKRWEERLRKVAKPSNTPNRKHCPNPDT